MLKELCYVVDSNDQPLSRTNFNKGWYLVRKNKATIVGYIIALDDNKKTCSFVGLDGKAYRRYGLNRCKLIQRPKSINFI